MRLVDLESNNYLYEETLTTQQISNLFQAVANIVSRNPIGSNRTLLGRMVDRVIKPNQEQQMIDTSYKQLEQKLSVSTADPTIGPKIDPIIRNILAKTKNDSVIKAKFDEFEQTMIQKPKIQKFMLDLANTVSSLVDRGLDRQDIVNLLNRVDALIASVPLQMGTAATSAQQPTQQPPTAGSVPNNTAVTEQQLDENLLSLSKVTYEKLVKAWENSNPRRPTDSAKIAQILLDPKVGVGEDQAREAFEKIGIEFPGTSTTVRSSGQTRQRVASRTTAGTSSSSDNITNKSSSTGTKKIQTADHAIDHFDRYYMLVNQLKKSDRNKVKEHIKTVLDAP